MASFKLAGICVLISTLALSGCVTRTYNLTRDRVDQELSSSSGNRGYLMGQAPEPKERTTTRTTRVFEIELGRRSKVETNCPAATPLNTEIIQEPRMVSETQTQETSLNYEQYTVVKNDTLQKISKKFYGTTKKWLKLYEVNKNVLSGPDKLYAGQVLNIPSDLKLDTQSQAAQESEMNLK